MKEYKVVYIKPGMNPEKIAKKTEDILNEMGGQGWELKVNAGV